MRFEPEWPLPVRLVAFLERKRSERSGRSRFRDLSARIEAYVVSELRRPRGGGVLHGTENLRARAAYVSERHRHAESAEKPLLGIELGTCPMTLNPAVAATER
jgi:hypothetical protein